MWSSVLKASAHRYRGELTDELAERLRQYQTTEMPLVLASLARVLKAMGSDEHAGRVIEELRHLEVTVHSGQ